MPFLASSRGCQANDVEIHRCTPARVGFVNVPNDSLPILCYILHCHRPRDRNVQTHFYTRVLFLMPCHSYLSLSLPLFLFFSSFGWRATECWIKRKKPGITAFPVVARISRNKSTRFSFSFFLSFNSFEHLLLVISCFPSPFLFTSLCTLLVDNSSMLGQQQKRRRCGKKNFERCNQIEL